MKVVLSIALALVFAGVSAAGGTTSYHQNTHAHSAWHFPAKMEKLQRYRTIARHDRWVKKTDKAHPTWFPHWLVALHKRELRHANAHIKKIEAKLNPPFTYPWWWVPLGICETGSNPPDPGYNDGLYEGWINFLNSTWLTYGGGQYAAHAYDATEYEQYLVTLAMHADVPWSQSNPACSARLGM